MAGPLSVPDAWRLVAPGYAAHLLPFFTFYAERALALADVGPASVVLDVACGPGTLALQAAPRVARVDALDFAPEMIDILRRRIAEQGADNVTATQGDGQALPSADYAYDAAFSMFGLMFFPDRHRGLCELRRVLRPGGVAAVAAWPPAAEVPAMAAILGAMGRVLPEMGGALDGPPPPMSSPERMRAELEAAGLRDVAVHEVVQEGEVATVEEFWQVNLESSAPLALMRRDMPPEAFAQLSADMVAELRQDLGPGPIALRWPALLGLGRA